MTMSTIPTLDKARCLDFGLYPLQNRTEVIGQNFCYDWQRVQTAAKKAYLNLDHFLCLPIGSRLTEKGLKSPVTFWYTPLNKHFVITVCSKRKTDFFDPLHDLPGYMEYGGDYLRPTARPFLHWDGSRIVRVHAIESPYDSECLVADFWNLFGLTVSESGESQYNKIRSQPEDYFEYSAVPCETEEDLSWKGHKFTINHALCLLI